MGSIVSKKKGDNDSSRMNRKQKQRRENDANNAESDSNTTMGFAMDEETPGNPALSDDALSENNDNTRRDSIHEHAPAPINDALFMSPSKRPTFKSLPLIPLSKELPEVVLYANTLVAQYLNPFVWNQYRRRTDAGGFGFDLIVNLTWYLAREGSSPLNTDLVTDQMTIDEYDLRTNGCIIPSADCYDEFGAGFLFRIIERIHHPFEIHINEYFSINSGHLDKRYEASSTHAINSSASWNSTPFSTQIIPLQNHSSNIHCCTLAHNVHTPLRLVLSRNLLDFPFSSGISNEQRAEVKDILLTHITNALVSLGTSFPSGRFYALSTLNESQHERLVEKGLCFAKNPTNDAAGINRDWPEDRVVWISDDETFAIWINELDHLQLVSFTSIHNVCEGFERMGALIQRLEKELTFSTHPMLGYLSSSLARLGSGMQASIVVRLPHCAQQRTQFHSFVHEHNMRAVEFDATNHSYLLTNRRSLGESESQCVLHVLQGVYALLEWERELEERDDESALVTDVSFLQDEDRSVGVAPEIPILAVE